MIMRKKLIKYLEKIESNASRNRDLEVAETGGLRFVTCPMGYKDVTGVTDVYQLGRKMEGCECVDDCEKCWKEVLGEDGFMSKWRCFIRTNFLRFIRNK